MSYSQEVSLPAIYFADTTVGSNLWIYPKRPSLVRISDTRRVNENESLSGRIETVGFWVGRAEIEVQWQYLEGPQTSGHEDYYGPLWMFRRLWLSCWDGTPFLFYVHKDLTTGYPDTYSPHMTHRNLYTVRFHPDQKSFDFEDQDGVKDRHFVPLKLREVIS